MASFGTIVACIGAILIAVGVAWLIASNWHQIPSFLKILILVIATASAYTSGVLLKTHEYQKIGASLIVLGALLYTLSVFLIAQIFSTAVSLQGTAFLLLLAFLGVYLTSYIFDSSFSLVVALLEFVIWITIQYLAFYEHSLLRGQLSVGGLALTYLVAGVLVYGLSLLHKSSEHKFSQLYEWWTVFYFLAFAYLLSFQSLLPALWPSGITLASGTLIFLSLLTLLSVLVCAIGAVRALHAEKLQGKELTAFIGLVVILVILITAASFISGALGTCSLKSCSSLSTKQACESASLPGQVCEWQTNYCAQKGCYNYLNKDDCRQAPAELKCDWINTTFNEYCQQEVNDQYTLSETLCGKYTNERTSCLAREQCTWNAQYFYSSRGTNAPTSVWLLWIFANIIFLALILTVLGYGTWHKSTKIVNIGIVFFALDILTRYIGFIIDFGWYTSLAFVFISGGIVLIFGGWLLERWRRKLVAQAQEA